MLFADDAAVSAHTKYGLQQLMSRFSHACCDFGLTTSLKKTNVLGQNVDTPPVITGTREKRSAHVCLPSFPRIFAFEIIRDNKTN